jgi:hypothetical protein
MITHEKHCASVTMLLMSDPPQVPKCDCNASKDKDDGFNRSYWGLVSAYLKANIKP